MINLPSLYFMADVKQTMLETIVPKNESDAIMVVLGEHRGQVSGCYHGKECAIMCTFFSVVLM